MTILVTISSLLRYDTDGQGLLYLGKYDLALNNERSAVTQLTLIGRDVVIRTWPKKEQQVGRSPEAEKLIIGRKSEVCKIK